MSTVKINFNSETVNKIKPLHGVNSGPCTKVFTFNAKPLFKEAGFPYVRLHDIEYPYGSGEFVDIHCIFQNFDADETKEENYNFALTDEYLKACVEVGSMPFFRLGVSIEHAPVKRHIFPPKDYAKWARICEHIILHYTEGWANGFHWDIQYWEIWNEPDSCAFGSINMWYGTQEEFFEFYCVSATYLKKRFPHLKIGGCAFMGGYNRFIKAFFEYITAKPERIPMDFYSWHFYTTDINRMLEESEKANTVLQKYGYQDAESIFNEWNYMNDWSEQHKSYPFVKNYVGASFCASMLSALQSRTNVLVAAYFHAEVITEWSGLFDVDKMSIGTIKSTVSPRKPFYAFKAFNELYKMGNEKRVEYDPDSLYVTAASNDTSAGIIIANYNGEDTEIELDLSGLPAGEIEIRIVDEERTFDKIMSFETTNGAIKTKFPLTKNAFVYIGSAIETV